MKMIIAGGRDFNHWGSFFTVVNQWKFIITEVVCGDAAGADSLGASWAQKNNIPVKHFTANWEMYGKTAGHIRNAEMAEYADGLIAFWDGKSKGTKNMIKAMKFQKKPYKVYNYQGQLIDESR